MLRLVFIIGFCLALLSAHVPSLWAAADSLMSYEIRLEDNPSQAHQWARQELPRIPQEQEPERYIRTFWLAIELNHPETKALLPLLPQVMSMAETRGLKEEWFRLKMQALRAELYQKKIGKNAAYFETLIAEGKRLDVPRLLARVLFDYAYHLSAKGDLSSSQKYQQEAFQLLSSQPMADFDQAILKNEMAILLVKHDQIERAMPMLREVAAYCEKAQVRAFAAVALYNLARLYDLRKTEDAARKAISWYELSYNAAIAVDDQETLASSQYGLGSGSLTLKDYPSAQQYLNRALALFKKQNDQYWMVETLLLLAKAARQQDQFQQALSYLQEAQPLLSDQDLKLRHQWHEESALAWHGLGRYEKSSELLILTLEAARQRFAQQQKEDYQKRTVEMGLQVEEERNKVLQRENELQAQKLVQAQAYRLYFFVLSSLLLVLAIFIGMAIIQTRRVRQSKIKMREILDHIEEGIVTIDRRLNIEAEYSAYVHSFTHNQNPLQGQPFISTFLDHSELRSEDKSILRETLEMALGEERLSWELNEAQLPHELMFPGQPPRVAALHWVPMFDSHGVLQRVLLTLRDVTEQYRLSHRLIEQENRARQLQIKVRELLEAPISSVVTLMRDISQLHASQDSPDIRRHLHTFKGVARSLGLKCLSQSIHDLENNLSDQELWTSFWQEVEQYESLVQQHPQSRASRNLQSIIAELLPAFLEQMQDGSCAVEVFTIQDGVLKWPERLLSDIKKALVHVLSNCADHGYIRPQKLSYRVAPARIHIQAQRAGNVIELHIRDNGVGLNEDVLSAAAASRKFTTGSRGTVFDVVFLEGFSTAADSNLTSGRGVGLAAVASICQQWQGEAHIAPLSASGGTHMVLSFQVQP